MNTNDIFSVLLGDTPTSYQLRRSRRAKHIRMTIDDEGNLLVTIPSRGRSLDVERTLRNHQKWILRKKREAEKKKRKPPPFELRDGAQLPVLAHFYTLFLKTAEHQTAYWHMENNRLTLTAPRFTPSLIYHGLEQWYRKMAQLFLEDRVSYWANKMDVCPNKIYVKNQHTLWGSCSKKKNLNFNWRILLLSERAADYLIIHELAHLKELNHSPKFWDFVSTHCPDYQIYKAELKLKETWLKFPKPEDIQKSALKK
ncbi:MAG: SprT family zinc-dependent metalloprotease [Candidatus Aminicenantes bacterium]|jgi:predicted metal-dependent hydrolase